MLTFDAHFAMSPTRLRALVAVARTGSIAAAAQELSFTPSAVSQQLSRLEAELGARLFERLSRALVPTSVGAVLLEHAERILGELRDAETAVQTALGDTRQRLALASFSTAAHLVVPSALAALKAEYPKAALSLNDLEPPRGYDLVASADVDLLITHRYPGVEPIRHPTLVQRQLGVDALTVALPNTHRLDHRSPTYGVALAELVDETWISGAVGVPNRTALTVLASEDGFVPRVAYETADYQVTLGLVAAGLGVAVIPESLRADAQRHGLRLRRFRGVHATREVSAVHRRNPPAMLSRFIDLLCDAANPGGEYSNG
jgi:DNA-binding transcriptional LysR family regulator